MVWLMVILCASCGPTDREKVRKAAQSFGATNAKAALPELNADCRRVSRSGVELGDRLDIALRKADAALARQNARTRRCAVWYDELRAGFKATGMPQ